jgi:hypothetical protein
VRSIPMLTLILFFLHSPGDVKRGGHCYFEPDKPLSSLSSRGADEEACHERAAPMTPVGSPKSERLADIGTESGPHRSCDRSLSSR